MPLFLTVALSVCIAEMGDKTQLLVMGMASKYKLKDIAAGMACACLLLGATAAYLGRTTGCLLPPELIGLIAGAFFLVFAVRSIAVGQKEEARALKKSALPDALAIGVAFVLAELGDKTQLATMAFGAGAPDRWVEVMLGGAVGLAAGSAAGAALGALLGSRMPDWALEILSFAMFAFFGFTRLYGALKVIAGAPDVAIAGVAVAFMAASAFRYKKRRGALRKMGRAA